MLAARLFKVGDIRAVDVPMPQAQPGDIVVKIDAAGICGTDRHLFKGEFPCIDNTTFKRIFSAKLCHSEN